MKKIVFLICLVILSYNIIYAQAESSDQRIKQTFLSISPLISPKVCVGMNFAKQNKKNHWVEYDYYFHIFHSTGLQTFGFAATYNYFWNNTRKGYFTQLTAEIERVYFTGFDSNSDVIDGIAPGIAAGFGYSYQVKENSFLRIYLDIGYKWFLSNLHISYIW